MPPTRNLSTRRSREAPYQWGQHQIAVFLEMHKDAVRRGMRSSTGWKPQVAEDIMERFVAEGWPPLTKENVKTKRDNLKKDWKEYRWLSERSGFGISGGVLTASDETWENLLAAWPKFKKWRKRPLDNKEDLDFIFYGTAATGAFAQS